MIPPVLERARRVAEDVLFPNAIQTDAADLVPASGLDALAREGLYGVAGPTQAGGADVDLAGFNAVVEALASGCLTTAFVWIQHHNPVRAVAASQTPGLAERWLGPLCRGEVRAGIALAGERPGAASMNATVRPDGVVLNGDAPWVTGWGLIDVVMVAARMADDTVVRVLMDATGSERVGVERLSLVAADASGTVTLRLRDHAVALDRVVGQEPLADAVARDPLRLRVNASLALGVTARCARLIGPSPLDDELNDTRRELDAATPEQLPAARARASLLALRAASTLTVTDGGRSLLMEHHAQRLVREAIFLLVFATRPAIREELLQRLNDPSGG